MGGDLRASAQPGQQVSGIPEGLGGWDGQVGLGQACRDRVLKDCEGDKKASCLLKTLGGLREQRSRRTSGEEQEGGRPRGHEPEKDLGADSLAGAEGMQGRVALQPVSSGSPGRRDKRSAGSREPTNHCPEPGFRTRKAWGREAERLWGSTVSAGGSATVSAGGSSFPTVPSSCLLPGLGCASAHSLLFPTGPEPSQEGQPRGPRKATACGSRCICPAQLLLNPESVHVGTGSPQPQDTSCQRRQEPSPSDQDPSLLGAVLRL